MTGLGRGRLTKAQGWEPDETQTKSGEPRKLAVKLNEPMTPTTSSVARKEYDPFYERRAELRNSKVKGEQVCGWIATCWREDLACLIVKISAVEWQAYKLDNPDALDEALLLAAGMAYAEMRASALGINNRRNQRTMAIAVIKLMDLPLAKVAKDEDGDGKVQLTGLEGLSEEEIEALADLEG